MSAIGPQFYEFMKKLDENGGKLPTSITSRAFQPEFEFNNSTCYLCNGYYGPSFGEPVCVTCHEFLYPDIPNPNSFLFSEKTDDGDSGNDEPSVGELMYYDRRLTRALQQQGLPNWAFRFQSSLDSEASPDEPIDLSCQPLQSLSNNLGPNRDDPNNGGPIPASCAGPNTSGSSGGGLNISSNCGGSNNNAIHGNRNDGNDNCGGPNRGPTDGDSNSDHNGWDPNRGLDDGGPSRSPNDGGPSRGPNSGVPNRGPNGGGPSRAPSHGGLNRRPNGEGPSRAPSEGGPNRGANGGGPSRAPSDGGPSRGPNGGGPSRGPSDGGPSRGPNDAGPSHDDGLGPAVPDDGHSRPLPSNLARSLAALSTPRLPDNLAPGLVEQLPSEVLLCMFSYLDDLSLCACAQVCVRWLRLVRARVSQARWAGFATRRWPLFRPMLSVPDWHKKYQALVESCFCRNCVVQMCMQSQPPFEENAWRRNRLRNEIKMLRNAPPEGCAATPLDPKCCHWQAMVTGPVGSPYEGGVFFLYIQVPYSYPMSPPVVRFLTRILHPNVSRHGDVGIDSVHHNWSLALTISKLLISIQSLLTDPYTNVCMEPDVGDMYVNERPRFERIARRWTWRYAMHDMYSIC